MTKPVKKTDAFINAYNKLGISDPVKRSQFLSYNNLSQTECEDFYRGHWVNRRAVEVIPSDLFRKGVLFKCEDIELEKQISSKIEEIGINNYFIEACVLAGIYGGSLLVMGINDGKNPEEELNVNNIKSIDYFHVLDRFKVVVEKKYTNPLSKKYNTPELYSVTSTDGKKYVIHESRVLRFDGDYLPPALVDKNDGWYDSVYLAIQDTLKQYTSAMDNGATLFTDFVTKVLKINNLIDLLQKQKSGDNSLEKRIAFANSKVASHNIVLIGEGEEYQKITSTVAGLKELMDLYIEAVCGCTTIPRTRLFGQQLGVLAGASEQTRAYYDVVKAYGNKKVKNNYELLLTYLIKTVNKEPENWSWDFAPLWQDTQKEILEQQKLQADIDMAYLNTGVVTPEEIAVSRYTDRGYSFDTHIETELRSREGGQEEGTPTPDSE